MYFFVHGFDVLKGFSVFGEVCNIFDGVLDYQTSLDEFFQAVFIDELLFLFDEFSVMALTDTEHRLSAIFLVEGVDGDGDGLLFLREECKGVLLGVHPDFRVLVPVEDDRFPELVCRSIPFVLADFC